MKATRKFSHSPFSKSLLILALLHAAFQERTVSNNFIQMERSVGGYDSMPAMVSMKLEDRREMIKNLKENIDNLKKKIEDFKIGVKKQVDGLPELTLQHLEKVQENIIKKTKDMNKSANQKKVI